MLNDATCFREVYSSKILLKKTIELIATKGYSVGNIDATICAERPKLKTYIPEMQRDPLLRILECEYIAILRQNHTCQSHA